jgi:hypothetical protein
MAGGKERAAATSTEEGSDQRVTEHQKEGAIMSLHKGFIHAFLSFIVTMQISMCVHVMCYVVSYASVVNIQIFKKSSPSLLTIRPYQSPIMNPS